MTTTTSPELLADKTILWTSVATDLAGNTRVAVNDGVVYGWGSNSSFQLGASQDFTADTPTQISELSEIGTFKSVSVGEGFAAYLTVDGRVFLLGDIVGITASLQPTSTPVQIDTGSYTIERITCGPRCIFMITTDFDLLVIGTHSSLSGNALGLGATQSVTTPTLVNGQRGWTRIATDGKHTIAVNGGQLFTWGDNNFGQLGTNNTISTSTPQLVTSISPAALWQEVAVSNNRSAAIFNTVLYAWGDNSENLLGLESAPSVVSIPTTVTSGLQQFDSCTSVSLGTRHMVFVSNGDIYAFGDNTAGVTGIGLTSGITTVPTLIDSTRNWITVAASDGQNLALAVGNDSPTNLYSWGFNSAYATAANTQLGILTNPNTVPGFSFTGDPIVDYPNGSKFHIGSFSMVYEGDLYTWGDNFNGIGGRGNSLISTTLPEKITTVAGRNWTRVQRGMGIHTGQLYTWGPNQNHLTLAGTATGHKDTPTIATVAPDGWTEISRGDSAAAGIRNGQLVGWGSNLFGISGTLGTGTTATPKVLDPRTDWNQVSVGFTHAAAIRNGRLYEWGDSTILGNTAAPLEIDADTDWQWVSCGNRYTLGIKGGKLYSWGINSEYQTGLGVDVGVTNTLTQVGIFDDWVKVHAGNGSSIGLRSNGEIYVWGRNLGNSLGVSTGTGYFNPPATQPTRLGDNTDWTDIFCFDSSGSGAYFGIRGISGTWEQLPTHVPEIPVNVPRVYSTGFTFNAGTELQTTSKEFILLPVTINQSTNYSTGDFHTLFVTQNTDIFATGSNTRIPGSPTGAPRLINSGGWSFANTRGAVYAGIENGNLFNLSGGSATLEDSGIYSDISITGVSGTRTWLGIKNGLLYARGSNTSGQTGLGLTSGSTTTITQVATELGSGWTAVELSDSSAACGIFNGLLYTWGSNSLGLTAQGITGFTNFSVPTQVGSSAGWTKISMGTDHALAIRNGELYAWGSNDMGQLGLGWYGGVANLPTQVGNLTGWTHCYAGPKVSLAIRNNTLYVWGTHDFGRTGLGCFTGTSCSPIQSLIGNEVIDGAIGSAHGVFSINVPDISTPSIIPLNADTILDVPNASQLILATVNNTPRIMQVNQYGEFMSAEVSSTITGVGGGALLMNSGRTSARLLARQQSDFARYGQISADTTTITDLGAISVGGVSGQILVPPNTDKIVIFPASNTIYRFDTTTGIFTSISALGSSGFTATAFSPDGQFYYTGFGRVYKFDISTGDILETNLAPQSMTAAFVPGTDILLLRDSVNSATINFHRYATSGALSLVGSASPASISSTSIFGMCAVRSAVDNVPRLIVLTSGGCRIFTIDPVAVTLTEVLPAGSLVFNTGTFRTSPDYRFIYSGQDIFTYDPRSTPMVTRFTSSSSVLPLGLSNLTILDWK